MAAPQTASFKLGTLRMGPLSPENDARLRAKVRAAHALDPGYMNRINRHVNCKLHTQACKLRVEEHFAEAMGMTLQQWRDAEYSHRKGKAHSRVHHNHATGVTVSWA